MCFLTLYIFKRPILYVQITLTILYTYMYHLFSPTVSLVMEDHRSVSLCTVGVHQTKLVGSHLKRKKIIYSSDK